MSALIMHTEQVVHLIKALRPPKDFDIGKFDAELQCMALICALPDQFTMFTSTLVITGKLKMKELIAAFHTEEFKCRCRTDTNTNVAKCNAQLRNDPIPSAMVSRYAREKQSYFEANENMGAMHLEWHKHMEPHCFGIDNSIGDLSWDEEEYRKVCSQAEKQKCLRQTQPFRTDHTITPYEQKKISKSMEKRVSSARVNYMIFNDFHYDKALQYRHNSVPAEPTSWSSGITHSAVSGDGVNLVFYLPNTFTRHWTTSTTQWLIDFGSSEADYVHRAGELSGGITPIHGWHAIGSEVTQEKFKVGKDVLKTAQAYQEISEMLLKLGIVSCHVNSVLFHTTMASQHALATIDPLIYEGREVLFNRVSPPIESRSRWKLCQSY
ncbi:hypothetical protein FIBSPDRAFT_962394 [Athelia psychrophila]|uniref:Uncharacterized protein n=1 Tax=Athelia psychrophila TaxID=1759441 RepID=A0A166A6B7_9AGAM|nr:hypothetical protein FIBSPDRAFT_962394 [Fibularhizoctonia sp. CBS 109695]